MSLYFRPIPQIDAARSEAALALAGGWSWFDRVEVLERGRAPKIIGVGDVPKDVLSVLTTSRPGVAGLTLDRPRIMGILNVTPDSFSDGGDFAAADVATAAAAQMVKDGADIIDIGGESTRPGADFVSVEDEIARTAPVIKTLVKSVETPLSIDTRKSGVAQAALKAGAHILNDVSAMTFDPAMAGVVATSGAPICLMHAQGDPKTMQSDPSYDDVLLDVYDHLAQRITAAEAAGIPRARIIADPGIGFGKTLDHNLALLSKISLFHALGVPILLGASRKRFIGTIAGEADAKARGPGSVAVALAAIRQGVQIVRVHDIRDTRQAVLLDRAVTEGRTRGA